MGLFLRPDPDAVTASAQPLGGGRVHRAQAAAYNAQRGLTAAAERIVLDPSKPDLLRTKPYSDWQAQAWEGYDRVGEVHNGFSTLANLLTRIRIYPGVVDNPDEAPVNMVGAQRRGLIDEHTATICKQLMDRLLEAAVDLIRSFTLNTSVAGECYLIHLPKTDGTKTWIIVSTDEVRPGTLGGFQLRQIRNGQEIVQLPPDTWIARIWRKHPRFCADDRTEILTGRGWVTHDRLEVGDMVLTLDHVTGAACWQPVEAVNRFDVVDEPMHRLSSRSLSALVTSDHRWPTIGLHSRTRAWKTSATLKSSDLVPRSAPVEDLPVEPKWSDAMVELIGWWWTEGHDGDNTVISQSHRVNASYCARIRSVLTDLYGAPVTSKAQMVAGMKPTHSLCEFPDCGWPHWARGLCKAHDMQRRYGTELHPVRRRSTMPAYQQPRWREAVDVKKGMTTFVLNRAGAAELQRIAPKRQVSLDFIRSLTRAQLELFIATSLDADGHGQTITQSVRARLEPFYLACVLTGRSPRMTAYTDVRGNEAHRVHFTHRVEASVADVRRTVEPYTGVVWCPTTANGTWLARRDGISYFTGNSKEPDSSLLGVREPMQTLLMIDRWTRTIIRSRLNAGVLFIPDTVTSNLSTVETAEPVVEEPGTLDDLRNVAAADPSSSLLSDMIQMMSAPITDETNAASLVPMILQGPQDAGEKIKHILMSRDFDEWLAKQGDTALDRVLNGMDVPKEIITGLNQVKFSNAVVIDEGMYKASIEPLALMLADALTAVYLKPHLLANQVDPALVSKLVVWYDPTDIVTRPNAAEDATEGFDRGLLGPAAWRREHGFAESDEPTEEELALMLLTRSAVIPESILIAAARKVLGDDIQIPEPSGNSNGGVANNRGPINLSALRPHGEQDVQRRAVQQVGVNSGR